MFLSIGALLLASACARQEATSPATDTYDEPADTSATTEGYGESTEYGTATPEPSTTDPAATDPTMSGSESTTTPETQTTPPPANPDDPTASGETGTTSPDTEQPPQQ